MMKGKKAQTYLERLRVFYSEISAIEFETNEEEK